MKSLDLSKNVAVEALETEIKEREQQYKERLIQAEAEMREIFNDEISKSVHEIESKHKSALEKLSQQHQNALEAQQVEFTADKEEALAALREQMQKMFESVLQQRLDDAHQQHRDEIKVLEDVHQLALQNQNEELIKVKEEYESKLSTLHQQQQEEQADSAYITAPAQYRRSQSHLWFRHFHNLLHCWYLWSNLDPTSVSFCHFHDYY